MARPIYLDYAAATPLDPKVLEVMQPYFSDKFYNPSATYLAGRGVRLDLEAARAKIAGLLGARPSEVIFTAGATEANNLAVQGILKKFSGCEVLTGAIEHESVLAPAKMFKHKLIPVTNQGLVEPGVVEKMVTEHTVLISIGLVNNELGVVQPLQQIAQRLQKIRQLRLKNKNTTPLYLHTDAAQAGNYLDLHVSRLGVDLMSLNGGKIYGPKQSGMLYIKAGTQLEPIIIGGGQEFKLRSGTENVAACIGLAKALELAQTCRKDETERIGKLRILFEDELVRQIPTAIINGHSKHHAPHILSVTLPGCDNERLMMQLDELGVICGVGSACSASSSEASHVLSAIGLPDQAARSTLRFSLGKQTNSADIKKTIRHLRQLIT